MKSLTVAYMTNRLYPCVEWFLDSLRTEMETDSDAGNIRTVVVDFLQAERPNTLPAHVLHVPPKPCVWQGPHRLTTRDYFAAANARNTALCHARDGWIAYVDDLSVLLPGWLKRVRHAMREGYVACGAYRKVLGLEVVDGVVASFADHPSGHDSRWSMGDDTKAIHHGPGCLFGCSLAAPVKSLIDVNGWDESCDGMGYEDTAMGVMLTKRGATLKYDRRMMTYESEEMHHLSGSVFLRVDKKLPNATTDCPDASHAMLRRVRDGNGTAENTHFGPGGIRAMRARVLAGEPFPIPTEPRAHWPDGQLLKEM